MYNIFYYILFVVAKRSAPSSHVFAEFMGRGIVEVNIMNLPDLDEYERKVNE